MFHRKLFYTNDFLYPTALKNENVSNAVANLIQSKMVKIISLICKPATVEMRVIPAVWITLPKRNKGE